MMNRSEQNWPEDETTELVSEDAGPFGDYYVTRAKKERSQQLRDALESLNNFHAVIDYVRVVETSGSVFLPNYTEVL